MAFPSKFLNDDEDVIMDLRPHWATLANPVATVLVALGATIALVLVHVWHLHRVLTIAGLALTAAALVRFGFRYLRWVRTSFVVTTDRLVYRVGVIAQHGREIPLERISDIAYHQSLFERLIGTGDLTIESAGAHSAETFGDIPHPVAVHNEIYRQREAAEARRAQRLTGQPSLSIPEQIEKLDELRQRGVITQAEFDAKKQQLLDRL